MTTTKNIVVVDIDGTCSDPTHRLHWVKEKPKRWDKFHDEVGKDEVHEDIRKLVRLLWECGYRIVYVSGRMECCRKETLKWLFDNKFVLGPLQMRQDNDFRPDFIVKEEIANRCNLTPETVFLALDDRNQVVEMWRKRGIRCLQVQDGNF